MVTHRTRPKNIVLHHCVATNLTIRRINRRDSAVIQVVVGAALGAAMQPNLAHYFTWLNGYQITKKIEIRTMTFDVGMDTCSPVADDYFEKAPFKFAGKLKRLYFKNLQAEKPAFKRSGDDD